MMRIKWIENILEFRSKRTLLEKRYIFPQICSTFRFSITSKKNETIKNDEVEDDNMRKRKPIKFSTSKASKFLSGNKTKNVPEYQETVLVTCFAIFLLYFCVLREENDIDEAMIRNIPPEILRQIYGK
ncbi:protein ccsmst1 isoform X1 [Apis mellifera caucasica]|uniref:Protein ccsmst1 isoform X1 n=1 Tax=Apis mellifera TaxID=7460 RepID=A0A7M7IQJ0_APIME|nr:protein ccsmst1 isoform X1 [Apis mellifera]XP_006565004.1 protein ccsmst1 isoform X1 [Apis mellifera]XP_016771563.1 protein ccsmst1 isoform X1 [Apis mellifera]KAG6794539.1 protein ccsmst1 isoform X1 [Apis mellifera caucasica]KAG9429400.1 protein ccsmst1 isoform X1 [Apis mellifera carnica]|eukprot:XP_006565003.1 protein ccsmst1 isoform X1 [Apis mellifera]